MDADLDTLATALNVRVDDLLKNTPERAPSRPRTGFPPRLSDAELVTLSVMQALLGYPSEARWLRFAGKRLRHLFPYLLLQPGYNKRLRKLAATLAWVSGELAATGQRRRRRRLGRRLDPGRVRPVPRDRETLRPGRVGRIRVLRRPFPLLLGVTPPYRRDPARATAGVGPDRRESRRAHHLLEPPGDDHRPGHQPAPPTP